MVLSRHAGLMKSYLTDVFVGLKLKSALGTPQPNARRNGGTPFHRTLQECGEILVVGQFPFGHFLLCAKKPSQDVLGRRYAYISA